jgi:tetratricopeptide (TPR) repeat protein
MQIKPALRQRILRFLALFLDVTQGELAARCGKAAHRIWYLIFNKRKKRDIGEDLFLETLAALNWRPAHAASTAAWIESLDAGREGDVSPEEIDILELGVLEGSEQVRGVYRQLISRANAVPPLDGYPAPEHVEPIRWIARRQLEGLAALKEPDERLAVVRLVRGYQNWALMEIVAEESTHAASRSLEESASWARLAVEIAERVRAPEWWQSRVRGYAGAFGPNTLRVKGELEDASVALEEPKRLWRKGADPDGVLDPARLLSLEASLRRDQRKLAWSLDLLDEARPISHHPARVLMKKAFTQEVMGDCERAVATLQEAAPLVKQERDPRLSYMLRYNLAANYTHLGRFAEAIPLLKEVREIVTERRDENEFPRLAGIQARIAAGLGRPEEAISLLKTAAGQFAARGMWYDVAIAVLELAALLLKEGRRAEVRALTPKLTEVFKSRKVHREALAALRLFLDAAEADTADEGLARRVLSFLYRARHDKGLTLDES